MLTCGRGSRMKNHRASNQGGVWKSNEAVLKEVATSSYWVKSITQDCTRLRKKEIYISSCTVSVLFFLTPYSLHSLFQLKGSDKWLK